MALKPLHFNPWVKKTLWRLTVKGGKCSWCGCSHSVRFKYTMAKNKPEESDFESESFCNQKCCEYFLYNKEEAE